MKRILIVIAMTVFVAGTAGVVAQRTAGQAWAAVAPAPFNYAAKFVCGEFDKLSDPANPAVPEGPVKPGNYQTAINVHNPNSILVGLRKKAVLLFAGAAPSDETVFEEPKPPGQFFGAELPPDFGLEIDCQDIRRQLLGPVPPPAPVFIKGWVVILSAAPLDIEVVFTGHGYKPDPTTGITTREGFSLYVERVLPTQNVQ
jgi:hypothetical protein